MPNKIQFNQKLNLVLRHLIHFRPHGILRRSNMPDGSCRQLSPKIFTSKTFWGSPYWRHPSGDFKTYIKRLSFINRAGFISSAALFIISLLIIFPVYYKTNLAEAAGSLSDTTLSITSDNLVAGVDLLVTSDSGTFASSTSPMSFSVNTNNVTGYMLSISAKTGTDLTNSTAGTSFTSIDATNSTVAAGITADVFGNAGNTIYNNMWGFKPNYYKSTANSDKFYPSPTTNGVTLNKTSSANAANSLDTYTIAIGARATYSQPAGTYNNAYILNAVGNYPEYKITYNDASGESSDLPSTQEATSETNDKTTINFSDKIPTRDGYEFVGWCSVDNSSDPTSCSGITYAAGDEYALNTLSSNVVPLYAIWKQSMSIMQNLASSECTAMASQVKDIRDGSIYWIQRLDDGKCWMTQNLDYSITAEDVTNGLTSETTDLTAYGSGVYTSSQGYSQDSSTGIITWRPIRATIDATDVIDNSIPNWQVDYITPYSVDPGNWYWMGATFYSSANCIYLKGCTTKFTKTKSADTNNEHGHVGNYYNWPTAIASNDASSLVDVTHDVPSENPQNSICPAGWRLPTISSAASDVDGSTNEFARLNYLYNSDSSSSSQKLEASPLYFVRAGNIGRDALANSGYGGYYWSSTVYNNNVAYDMVFFSRNVYSATWNDRYYNLSIRCVMREGIEYIAYMQDFALLSDTEKTAVLASMPEDQQFRLKDKRDGKDYYVAKLKDGNIWMTQNLDYSITADDVANGLTSETTDLTSYGSGVYIDSRGYSFNNDVITWKPMNTTVDSVSDYLAYSENPSSVNPGDWYWVSNPFYASATCNYLDGCTAKFTKTMSDSTNGEHGHVGNYYNWPAAIAANSTSGLPKTTFRDPSKNPQNSICPAGWRLPTISNASNSVNGSTNEFSRLDYLYNSGSSSSQKLEASPLYFVRAGRAGTEGTLEFPGHDGIYWSSTIYDSSMSYSLVFGSGAVFPLNSYSRYYGVSVRCVAR